MGDCPCEDALGGGCQAGGMQQNPKFFVVWTYAGDNEGDSTDTLSDTDAFFSGDGTANEVCDILDMSENHWDVWDILDEYNKAEMDPDTHMHSLRAHEPDELTGVDDAASSSEATSVVAPASEIKLTRKRRKLRVKDPVLRDSTDCDQSGIRSRRANKGKWRPKKAGCRHLRMRS